MRHFLRLFVLTLVVLLAPSATRAADLSRFSLRFGAIGTNYDRQYYSGYGGYTTRFDLGHGAGPFLGAEVRMNRLLGLELSAARLSLAARVRTTRLVPISFDPLVLGEQVVLSERGHFNVEPLTLALLFHPWHGSRADVYFGPEVARVRYDDNLEEISRRDPEFAYGGKVGVELRLGRGAWGLAAEVGHLAVHHEVQEHDSYGSLRISTASLLLVAHGR